MQRQAAQEWSRFAELIADQTRVGLSLHACLYSDSAIHESLRLGPEAFQLAQVNRPYLRRQNQLLQFFI